MQQKTIITLTILTLLLSLGCEKEIVIVHNHNLIADGCIPEKIVSVGFLGVNENEYIYENNKLIRYGDKFVEYNNGLVSKITLGSKRYEEYYYNDQFQVNKSIIFREDDPEEGFMVIDEKEYKYEGNRIVEIIDIDSDETNLISYYPNSNNIDSIKRINSNSEIIEILIFQYDEYKNPQKNLLIPKFNYSWWIERGFENNVIQRKKIKIQDQGETQIWNYDMEYNAFGYPTKIVGNIDNFGFNSITEITYTKCE